MKILLDYKEMKMNLEAMFKRNGITDFADIDWIMVEATGQKRSMLPFYGKFSSEETEKIMKMATERVKRIPLAYILGKAYFFGREFKVNKNVLIPRQDTEILIEKICSDIESRKSEVSVLDIGTGSGAIAVTIALETNAKVLAVDISKEALAVANENAYLLEVNVEFLQSDVFENVQGKFDFIVSNPPYIETSVVETLETEVRENEPILALDGGEDGLKFYRNIVSNAPKHLNPNGKLYFEIGYNQAEAVVQLMQKDFGNIEVYKDYGNNNRVVVGELL